jgi:hypothetical protein
MNIALGIRLRNIIHGPHSSIHGIRNRDPEFPVIGSPYCLLIRQFPGQGIIFSRHTEFM